MNQILHEGNTFIFILNKGEEFIDTLTDYCTKNSFSSGWIHALGACGELTLAWYNLETKEYEDHIYTEDLEIAAITGNIALVKGKPFIHAHGIFGRRDMSTIGGHIRKMVISATCEVKLEIYSGKIHRAFDERTGLNLMNCNVDK